MESDLAAKLHLSREHSLISREERERLLRQRGATVWLTGLSGAGKSTLARALEASLLQDGHWCTLLDGDNIRHGLNADLGFSAEDRHENIRRIARVAELFNDAGLIVVTAFISPYRRDRDMARTIIGADRFCEVHVSTPLHVCESRDAKGLYRKARAGELPHFTGISDPYEAPERPDLTLDTSSLSPEEGAGKIMAWLVAHGFINAEAASIRE